MTADTDQTFRSVDPLHHIEGLTSVSDRGVRKKKQPKQKKKRSDKQHQSTAEQLSDELDAADSVEKNCDEGHIDFRA